MSVIKKPFVSEKLAKRRKDVSKSRRILLIFILVITVTALSLVVYAHRFFIKDTEVVGTKIVPAEEVRSYVENEISGLNFIIPKRNIFFYPKNKIYNKLAIAFPRLGTINLEVKNKILVISIIEREPAYLWCGEQLPSTRLQAFSNQCYFVDAKGFIFSVAPQFSESVYPKIYTTLSENLSSADNGPISKQAMSAEVLSNVSILAKQITSKIIKPSAFSVTADGDAIVFLFRDSDILPEVRYNPTHDPLTTSANFNTAISNEVLKSKLESVFSTLEYIDVRFSNKVFYKFNNEVEKGKLISDATPKQ